MALVNVRRDVSDAFYRYKMERLQTKIEGKGNGIKTVVVNLSSVAQSLARPGSYVIKYFGFELGAQTNIDPKDDRWIINGAHDAAKLQDHLDGFINKFVLCKKCKNPETDVVIKDDHIVLDCKACGQRTDVDLRLKLSGFILKNQPRKGKKDKAERRAAKKAKQNGHAKENGGPGSGEDGSEHGSNEAGDFTNNNGGDVSDDEFLKVQAEAITAASADVEVKEDEWAVDMSEEAVKARQAQLPGELKQKLNIGGDDDDDDGEGGGNTVYDELGNWIAQQADEKGGIDNVDSINIYLKAKELGIEAKHRSVLVLVQTVFDKNIVAQIPKRASMLKQVGSPFFPLYIVPSTNNSSSSRRKSTKRPSSAAPSASSAASARTTPKCSSRLSRSCSSTTTTTSSARRWSCPGAPRPARSTSTSPPRARCARPPSPLSTGSRRPTRRSRRTRTKGRGRVTSFIACLPSSVRLTTLCVDVGVWLWQRAMPYWFIFFVFGLYDGLLCVVARLVP